MNEVTSAMASAWDSSIKQEVVNRFEEMNTFLDSCQQDTIDASGQGVRTNRQSLLGIRRIHVRTLSISMQNPLRENGLVGLGP